MDKLRSYKTLLIVTFLINAVLVSTHKGEFWPFSIFPMFSQAGNPWSRGVVIQVEDPNKDLIWENKTLEEIKQDAVSLEQNGIDNIDYANFISKTKNWDSQRVRALRDLFEIDRHNRSWMAMRVRGYLTETDSVVVEAIPMFIFTPDTTMRNPKLFPNK